MITTKLPKPGAWEPFKAQGFWISSQGDYPPHSPLSHPLYFSPFSLSGFGRIPTARREVQGRISAPEAENKWQEGMRRDQGTLGWKLLNLIRTNLQRAIVCKPQDWLQPLRDGQGWTLRRGLRTPAVDTGYAKTKGTLRMAQNEQFSRF